MLTRIEVDGFKNLLGFSAEFGPFTCIAGPNAVGKSNLFDAIEFLSLLAEYPLEEAAEKLRETAGSIESSRRLFWTDGELRAETISIAAEMVVPTVVFDRLGVPALPDDVCLRYELELRWDDGLRLVAERLLSLGGSLEDHLPFPHPPDFAILYGNRLGTSPQPETIYDIQHGKLPGKQQTRFDPSKARWTVLSQYTTADFPALLAANWELRSWRRFALDPASLRAPDPIGSHHDLSPRGQHLPAQLRRLTHAHMPDIIPYDEHELSALLAVRLGPVASIREIRVHEDSNTGLMTVRVTLRSGEELSARELSDGTLRYLALAVLELNSQAGVFCIEEPENGIDPPRIDALYELLKEIAMDLDDPTLVETDPAQIDPEEEVPPLRQVIVNTHSSELVSEVYRRSPEDLLIASAVLITKPDGTTARVLRLDPIHGTWRCSDQNRGVNLPVATYVKAAVRPWARAGVAEDK